MGKKETSKRANGPTWPALLSRDELARYLMLPTSEVAIRMRRRAFPPGIIVANRERWRRTDIDDWIRARCPHYEQWLAAGRPAEGLDHSMAT